MATRLFWISGISRGRLAVSARPCGGDDLASEVDGWKRNGVDTVVSLLTPSEIRELQLDGEREACRAAGIEFIHFPIADRGLPDSAAAFTALIRRIEAQLEQNRGVLIHCRAGIGRTGMLASLVLIALGADADSAFARVGARRAPVRVPDTGEQREWALKIARELVPAATASRISPTS